MSAFKKSWGVFCPPCQKWTGGVLSGGCFVLHSFDMVITWTFVLVFDLDNNENNNFITVYNLSLIEIPNHNGVNSYKIKVGKRETTYR